MLIDLIVGSALLLFGGFTWFWMRSAALRARIEAPKHVFLDHAQRQDSALRDNSVTIRDEGGKQA